MTPITAAGLFSGWVLAGALVLAGCGDGSTGGSSPPPKGPPATAPSSWRVESYGDVTLRVPPEWRLGYGPMREAGEILRCGEPDSGPYVGRPELGSDMCVAIDPDQVRRSGFDQEAIWFDSPLAVGSTDKGIASETVAVGDHRVTVAARDAAVRNQILGTVAPITDVDGNGCSASPRRHSDPLPEEGIGAVLTFAVCAYDADDELVWSGVRPPGDGDTLIDRVAHGDGLRGRPDASEDLDSVQLVLAADDAFGGKPVRRVYSVAFDPARIATPEGDAVVLTPEIVEPWAADGVRSYVFGGPLPADLQRYFRPIWG